MKPAFVLLAAVPFVLTAEPYYRAAFQEGYTYSAKPTAIYASPDMLADTVVMVPTGEAIFIIELAAVTETRDGTLWGWYKAEWPHEFGSKSGYIFEPDLASSHLVLGNDSLLVYRTMGFGEDTTAGVVSVIVSGEVQAELQVRPDWLEPLQPVSSAVNMCLLDPSGLTGVRNLVSLYSGNSTMGQNDRQYLLVWTCDGRLIEGPQAPGAAPGGSMTYRTEVTLPSDDGGIEDRIMLNVLGEVYDPYTDSLETFIEETEVYLWTGDEFIVNS